MFGKYMLIHLLSLTTAIIISAAQQTFQHKGEHYHAKVAIRRGEPNFNNGQVNSQSQLPLMYRTSGRNQRPPWRQGDRITKEEVVQNLARALLSRKKTAKEIQNERRKSNEEKLQEYTLYQARLAQARSKEAAPIKLSNTQPPTPPPYLPEHPPISYYSPRSRGQLRQSHTGSFQQGSFEEQRKYGGLKGKQKVANR